MGQKTALYNTTSGQIQGFFDSVDSPVPATLPAGATTIDITDAEWHDAISNQGKCTVVNGVWTVAAVWPPEPTLPQVQQAQLVTLFAAYQSAIAQPVTYTTAGSGGITKTYQADPNSQAILSKEILVYLAQGGTTPAGYYWVAADNTQVPFKFADLQGLAAAMGANGWAAFQHLQTQKASVLAATTVAQVQSIVW